MMNNSTETVSNALFLRKLALQLFLTGLCGLFFLYALVSRALSQGFGSLGGYNQIAYIYGTILVFITPILLGLILRTDWYGVESGVMGAIWVNFSPRTLLSIL